MANDSKNINLENIFLTKEESLLLSKVRIINKNLVHVNGFTQSLKNIQKLRGNEYFGQYGTIKRILLNHKKNPETNKTSFSIYITYSNEIEASYAILSVDSLVIEGEIIRAFFGTTKYCYYFLNNKICPNIDKCHFLHKIYKEKDFIIDSDTPFSYEDHLNLAKNIIQFSNPEASMTKIEKSSFVHNKENSKILFNSEPKFSSEELNNNLVNNFGENNNLYKNVDYNNINNNIIENVVNSPITKDMSNKINKNNEPSNLALHNIFKNTIDYILLVKPFFIKLEKNIPLKEMEFNYFKKELKKREIDIFALLNGCLDSVNNI